MPGPLFPVQNFVGKPYSGALQSIVVSLLSKGGVMTNDGQTVQQGSQSRIVNCQIDFLSTTYKGQAVVINLQSQQSAGPLLDKILMVYVDNELNSQNVTIAFPDTQQYIGVPAFTTGYYPVLTGQKLAVIYNGDTGKVPITSASQVSVIFCNFAIPGFLSQETLNVTFENSGGPVVPVLGDTTSTVVVSTLSGAGIFSAEILPIIVDPNRYVVTSISINATNLFSPPNGSFPLFILLGAQTGVNGTIIREYIFQVRTAMEGQAFFQIAEETDLNIPMTHLQMFLQTSQGGANLTLSQWPLWAFLTISVTYSLVQL